MPITINTNVSSLNAQRFLTSNSKMLAKSQEKLASGYRINKAGDDAAGLALSEKLRSQIRGSQKASDNVQDGLNVMNIADGAMQSVTDYLQRMRELAVQAGNDTYSSVQRSAMVQEINQIVSGVNQISASTQFNGIFLLNGTTPATNFRLQIGANSNSGVDTLNIGTQGVFDNLDATALGIGSLSIDSSTNALGAIASLDTALATLNSRRATIGAVSNRLETTASNLASNIENTSSSESRIRDVDVAQESANLSKNQILQQAAAAMLTQANQNPQLALKLIQGQ